MTECDSYDELFVAACDSVSSLDESDLELPPSQLEKRWETIVKLTAKCKNLRSAAQKQWNTGALIWIILIIIFYAMPNHMLSCISLP